MAETTCSVYDVAKAGYIAAKQEEHAKAAQDAADFDKPPFKAHTPESLRAAANAMRKRMGLGPLPEPTV
jgi:hypothetical protein